MNTVIPQPLPAADEPVAGVGISPASLAGVVGEGPTLLVFLRHAGCCFCRETIADMRRAHERETGFPDVVFVVQGEEGDARRLFRNRWADARVIVDTDARLYRAFEVERGGVGEMFGWQSWACGVRAVAKGNGIGRKVGDAWTLPTFVLVNAGTVVWEHRGAHAGDHPPASTIVEFARAPDP